MYTSKAATIRDEIADEFVERVTLNTFVYGMSLSDGLWQACEMIKDKYGMRTVETLTWSPVLSQAELDGVRKFMGNRFGGWGLLGAGK